MTAQAPSNAVAVKSLVARIATTANATADDVVDVLTTYGILLAFPPARPRHMRVQRLRVTGLRSGTDHDGPFDRTFNFDHDFKALVASNLRGKTSVLEIITWCLRGSPRDRLQVDVRRWLAQVELDATVSGQALGFRLSLDDGEMTRGTVLAAPNSDMLAGVNSASPCPEGVSVLIDSRDDEDFAAQVSTLMLDRLDLQPVVNAVKKSTQEDDQVATQTHGWPTYFSAINLPAGPDKPLVGEQTMGGLAGRLLQVFLDLPAAAVLTRVRTALGVVRAEDTRDRQRAQHVADQRAAEREQAGHALTAAQEELTRLRRQTPGPSLTELADAARRYAREVADSQDEWDELNRVYRSARSQRQADQKALNNVTESEVARLLFHGLDPSACPRCETPITTQRRRDELTGHRCSVCTAEVAGKPGEDDGEVVAEAQARLEASKAAENQARQELEAAEGTLSQLTARLDETQQQLRADTTSDAVRQLRNAELEVARREGALAMLPSEGVSVDRSKRRVLDVLAAADKILDQAARPPPRTCSPS